MDDDKNLSDESVEPEEELTPGMHVEGEEGAAPHVEGEDEEEDDDDEEESEEAM